MRWIVCDMGNRKVMRRFSGKNNLQPFENSSNIFIRKSFKPFAEESAASYENGRIRSNMLVKPIISKNMRNARQKMNSKKT